MIDVLIQRNAPLRSRMEYAVATGISMAGFGHRLLSERHGDEEIVFCYGSDERGLDTFCRDGGILIEMHPCPWLYDPRTDPSICHRIQNSSPLPFSHFTTPPHSPLALLGDDPFQEEKELFTLRRVGRGVRCSVHADLFGNLFFHLSRVEERLSPNRDDLGRFSSPDSQLGKSELLHRPLVDQIVGEWIWMVTQCGRQTGKMTLRKAFWPRGERFSASLSHDVDHPIKWTPKRIGYETGRAVRLLFSRKAVEGSRKLRRMIRSLAKCRDPYWTFEELMAREEQAGVRSSFYFAAKRRIKADPSYNACSRDVRGMIRALAAHGWEIGLHGSYDSYNDLPMLQDDKRTFEQAVSLMASGIRQHFLRFDSEVTWENQERAGFEYDATLGYADHEGFRAGTSFPFHPYDFDREGGRQFIEIPLAIMDGTLAQYRAYDEQEATACIGRFLGAARKDRGVFSFLVHQSFLDEEECPYMRRLYQHILSQIAKEQVYCVPGKELACWWRDREALKIESCPPIENQMPARNGTEQHGRDRSRPSTSMRLRGRESVEFVLRSERSIPHIVLILEPVAEPAQWEVTLSGCACRRRNEEEAIRLDLSSVEQNSTIRLTIQSVSEHPE
ncbi:MAG: polysaccharide deacetylase family protein [Candidatus Latescibacterota bacterium]